MNKKYLFFGGLAVAGIAAFFLMKKNAIVVNENWKALDSRNRTDAKLSSLAAGLSDMYKYHFGKGISSSMIDSLMMQFLPLEKVSGSAMALKSIETPWASESKKPFYGDITGYY